MKRKGSRAIQVYADEEVVWSGPGSLLAIRDMIERRKAELAGLDDTQYQKRQERKEDIEDLELEVEVLKRDGAEG